MAGWCSQFVGLHAGNYRSFHRFIQVLVRHALVRFHPGRCGLVLAWSSFVASRFLTYRRNPCLKRPPKGRRPVMHSCSIRLSHSTNGRWVSEALPRAYRVAFATEPILCQNRWVLLFAAEGNASSASHKAAGKSARDGPNGSTRLGPSPERAGEWE